MAKKKKHRKTRKQKLAKKNNLAGSSIAKSQSESLPKGKTKDNIVQSSNQPSKSASIVSSEHSDELMYVRHDVRRSLVLVGVILIVFVCLYFLLEKTSVGTLVYSIIKF